MTRDQKAAIVSSSLEYPDLVSAATDLGIPVSTLSRWRTAYERYGIEGLEDKRPGRCGRPTRFNLTEDEANALRAYVLAKGRLPLAVEELARDPLCREETRSEIYRELDAAARERREARWPMSLRRVGRVGAEMRAAFRGPKALGCVGSVDRRGMEYVDLEGRRMPMGPNVLWESDDMSSNEPYSYRDPDGGGVRVARQTLCTMDVYSASWLGAQPVARERDSYRAEDIVDHMLMCVRAHGLPLAWRLERGRWDNNAIYGIELPDGRRWGGIDGLIHILPAWTSGQKGGIETGFNFLQAIMAHWGLSVGRVRGEFEGANRTWRQATGGNQGAAERFWGISRCADGMAAAMADFNSRGKSRRAFGRGQVVPDELYRGFTRVDLPEPDAWRFLPVKVALTVRRGHVETTIKSYPMPFRYRVNGELGDLFLEGGYPVLCAFHPGRPEQGMHLFNGASTRDVRNREGWPVGHPFGVVPLANDAPQFSLAPVGPEAVAHRKRASAAVTSEFRAIMRGRDPRRHSVARNSAGDRAEISAGGQVDITVARAETAPPRRAERTAELDAELAEVERMEAEARAADPLGWE